MYRDVPDHHAPRRRRSWPAVLGVTAGLVALFVVLVVGLTAYGGGPTVPASRTPAAPASTATATATATAGPAGTVGDGTYQVGPDIAAGRWKTAGPGAESVLKNCYWARLRNDSGNTDAIIANGNSQGPASVTVKPGEFVQFTGGCDWRKVA